ncbi:DUF305 domain-containing protein [Pseudokineococcus marinus]|uniref:DUF305 domain-containing protein n=1 Tax=Pseudokineococcus marinus TaxID=351215 RepID=A0A849BK53_9ACTN|nr:DUF305 domain-containing protein [Pseudokineococcus marinus]NNH21735.1 DUF305 domain-containing protein [Pseudokineococcus marinus]
MKKTHRLAVAVAASAALSLGLAACSTDGSTVTAGPSNTPSPSTPGPSTPSSPGSSSPGSTGTATVAAEHNDADVAFAQQMIVHHRGALAMAQMADRRAQSPQVQALAERITAAQGPEIDAMSSWLRTWGQEVPDGMSIDGMSMDGMGGMGGMSHGPEMTGMMSSEQMDELEGMSGAGFDQMWLTGMVAHHEGAVEMSRTEQDQGANPQALALAEVIAADQTAEIDEMNQLLEQL